MNCLYIYLHDGPHLAFLLIFLVLFIFYAYACDVGEHLNATAMAFIKPEKYTFGLKLQLKMCTKLLKQPFGLSLPSTKLDPSNDALAEHLGHASTRDGRMVGQGWTGE